MGPTPPFSVAQNIDGKKSVHASPFRLALPLSGYQIRDRFLMPREWQGWSSYGQTGQK